MINKKLVSMIALVFSGAMPAAWAGNVRCMSVVLGHVLEDFDRVRISTGIVAQDTRYGHAEVNLGYVNENSVTIRDIGKDSFQVEILFDSADQGLRKALLKTTVYGVVYDSCVFDRSEKITYRLEVRQ